MHAQKPPSPRLDANGNSERAPGPLDIQVMERERQAFVEAVAAALTLACDGDADGARSLLRTELSRAQESGQRAMARELARVVDATQGLREPSAEHRQTRRTR